MKTTCNQLCLTGSIIARYDSLSFSGECMASVNLCQCGCGLEVELAKWTDKRRGVVKGEPLRFRRNHDKRLKTFVSPGLKKCPRCGEVKGATLEFFAPRKETFSGLTSTCRKCLAARVRAWMKGNRERYNAYAALYQRERRAANPELERCKQRRYTMRLRLEMIAAYGGKCECCGITEPEFLTLEHKFRDGAEHRRRLKRSGQTIWADLKKRGWPKDRYTILCWNCNLATSRGAPCPHKRVATPPVD